MCILAKYTYTNTNHETHECLPIGAVAMALSVAYLAAVALLESRGALQPPPCEATETCEEAIEAAALPIKHIITLAMAHL
jgi:hypothetical protein